MWNGADRGPQSFYVASLLDAAITGALEKLGGDTAVSYTHLTLPTIYSV